MLFLSLLVSFLCGLQFGVAPKETPPHNDGPHNDGPHDDGPHNGPHDDGPHNGPHDDGPHNDPDNDSQFDISTMLNSKSPYPARSVSPDTMNGCPGGSVIDYNIVIRHGARQPTSGDDATFLKMQTTLAAKGQYILNPQYSWMKTWVSPYQASVAGDLDQAGVLEQYYIAKRILQTFTQQFRYPYTPSTYPVLSTATARSSRSASAFTFSLFERTGTLGSAHFQPVSILSDTASQDTTLRFFDNCPAYVNGVVKNASVDVDSQLYLNLYSANILQKVKDKLQLQAGWNLTFDDVQVFYKLCAFDVALYRITNRFCTLFDFDDLYRFETSSDLSDWWLLGYGVPINAKMSCNLLKDFFTSFNNAIKVGGVEKAKFRFAHTETMISFSSLLGLFKDNFVLRFNSPQLDSRNWRTSVISPFSANIAMVLYNCSGTYKVKLLQNEIELPIPVCGGELFCNLTKLQTLWASELNCNFKTLCG